MELYVVFYWPAEQAIAEFVGVATTPDDAEHIIKFLVRHNPDRAYDAEGVLNYYYEPQTTNAVRYPGAEQVRPEIAK